MIQLENGMTVVHNGIEKTITEVHGDVIILDDKSVVSVNDVAVVNSPAAEVAAEPISEELAQEQASAKAMLRDRIEDIDEGTAAATLFNIIKDVDSNMMIQGADRDNIGLLRGTLLHKAMNAGKIDPKTCSACGQTIPE